MQKAAQSSQLKNGNLGGGRVYAFRVNRVNADYVCLKLWLLGGIIRARNIAVAALPDLIAQIDAALADGCERIALDGAEFSAPEKVLAGIKNEFSYCCLGASDANHVPVKPSSDSAESVKKCGAKPKASAPQGSASAARYLCKEELDGENHSSYRRAGSCGTINNAAIHCAMGGSDCTAPSASQVRPSCGAGVAADVAAIRAGLAEMREEQEEFFENLAALLVRIAEVLNEERKTKNELRRTSHSGARTRATVGAVISNEEPTDDETASQLGAAIRTRRGRTSVVVGVRKVAKFQPKTKGK